MSGDRRRVAASRDEDGDRAENRRGTRGKGAVYPFYDWLIVHIPWFVKLTDEQRAGHAADAEDRQTED